jgi:hypothetical protein
LFNRGNTRKNNLISQPDPYPLKNNEENNDESKGKNKYYSFKHYDIFIRERTRGYKFGFTK